MKRLTFSFVAVLLVTGAATACLHAKVQQPMPSDQQLTIIVMDTTQALLDDAEVRIGKLAMRTSYDGRIVLEPEQYAGIKKMAVSREGYLQQTVTIKDRKLILITLMPKAVKPVKDEKDKSEVYSFTGVSKSGVHKEGVRYEKDLVMPAILADEEERDYRDGAHIESTGAVPNKVSAGKLTAGEVNDFAKWHLWNKVIDGSHKEYIGDWGFSPNQRYTVQLKTTSGAPVSNRAVSLVDAQGNTLFQAVTDNTGKAELWASLIGHQQAPAAIRVSGLTGKDHPLTADERQLTTIVLDEPCELSDAADVMFVFDATGSMGDELHYLQAEMNDVISRAKEASGGLAIRTGAVVYRDHGDRYLTRLSRLTDDIKTTQAFIDNQQASGGGDFPEAVPEALMAALNSAGWDDQARARIAFLVLDAPCHRDSSTLALLHDQILNAAAAGVRIVPVVCSGLDKSGELLMRTIALATNGTSFFLTDDSGIGHSHLKPTTDTLKVEHLNDMLVRTIVEFTFMPLCPESEGTPIDAPFANDFIPNPFEAQDLAADPTIPHGESVHYLLDISGKLLGIYKGDIADSRQMIANIGLPIGVYFFKTYIDGRWYTQKILVP